MLDLFFKLLASNKNVTYICTEFKTNKMTFKQKVRLKLSKDGRKNQWLADQLGVHRKTLWLKLKEKSLDKTEKKQICEILEINLFERSKK